MNLHKNSDKEKFYCFVAGVAVMFGIVLASSVYDEASVLQFPDHGGTLHLTHVVTVTKYKEEIVKTPTAPKPGDVEAAVKIIDALPMCALNGMKNPITGERFNDFYCVSDAFIGEGKLSGSVWSVKEWEKGNY